ncbi:Connector enhancer of kinase suppressor of ras 3 [Aphelenchoides fujianensis]|nr:Connector enhancer of kinase suppressor of ras 3 [Aphelenchoides fujianensis]
MKKHPVFNTSNTNIAQIGEEKAEEFDFESWQTRHVLNWLRGIDETVAPYLRLFTQHHVNGVALSGLTDERLRRIGVNKDAVRRLILQGCNLLIYYAFEIKDENAQKLSMRVVVSVQNLMNAIDLATPVINNPAQSSRSLIVLNTVLMNVAEVHEDVTKLIFWLDR